MLGPLDYVLWFGSAFLELAVVVSAVRSRAFRWYLPLTLGMFFAFLINAARFVVFTQHGFRSLEYKYVYYYSDALWTILLYFSVMGLYQVTFEEMGVSRQIRHGSILLLGATSILSLWLVRQHDSQLTSRFVVELSQNLYFVGVVLTYLLWGALLKLRETRTRHVQIVLAMGIYFSASAGAYALRNMYPTLEISKFIPPLAGTFLPLAWAYTFWKVSPEARMAPARMVMPSR
jgi:hypothetical protein